MVYSLEMLQQYMAQNNLTRVHVHVNGITDLLIGNANSLALDHETATALQIDGDGDIVYLYQVELAKD